MKRKRNQNKNKRDRKSSLPAEPDSTTSYYSSGRTIYHDDQLRSLLDLTTSNCRFCNKSIPHFSPEEFISHLKVCNENHNQRNGKKSHEDEINLDTEIAHDTLSANDTYNQLVQQSLLRRKHGALKNYLPCSSKYIVSTNCEDSLSTPTVNMRQKMKNPRKKCSATAVRHEVNVIEERKHDNSQDGENEDCPAPENENTEPACSSHSESTIEAVENETTTIIIVDEIDDENTEQDEHPDPPSKGTLNEDSKGTGVCEEFKVKQRKRKSKSKRRRASWERDENHTSSSNSGLGKKREYMLPGPSWACKLSKFNNKSKSKKPKKKPKEKKSHNSSDSPFESNVDTSDDSSHPTRGRKAQKKPNTVHPSHVPFSISVKVQENNIMQTVLAPGSSTSQNNNLGDSSSKLTIVGKTKGSVKEYPEFRLTCAAATQQPSSPYTTSGDESSNKSVSQYKNNLPENIPTVIEENVEFRDDTDTGAQLDGNTVGTVAFEDVSQGSNTDKKEQEIPEENTGNTYLDEIISENMEDILGIIDILCTTTTENEVRNANPAIAENSNVFNEVNGDNLHERISPAPETVLNKTSQKSSSEHGQYCEYPTKNRRSLLAERWQPELLMPQYFRSQSQARAAIHAEEEYRVPNNSRPSLNALPTTGYPMAQSAVYSPSSPSISMRNVPQHIPMTVPVGQPPLIPHYDPYGTASPLNNHFPRNHFPPAMPAPHHSGYSGESHYQKTTTVHHIINVVSKQETLQIPMPQSLPAPSSQIHPYSSSGQQFHWPHFTSDRGQELIASMQTTSRQQTFAEGRNHSYTGIIPPHIAPISQASCYNCNCFIPNEIPSVTTPFIRSPFTPTHVPFCSPPIREQQPLFNSLKRAIRPQEEFHSPTHFDSGRKRSNYHNFNVYK